MKKALTVCLASLFAFASPVLARPDAETLLKQLTLDEKLSLLGGVNSFYTQAIPRLGIPALKMSDGPLGVRNYGLSTAYPAPVALAASWDVDLAQRAGRALGRDSRAYGVHILLTPGMNLYRAPMCSRNFEYLGEDPFLAGRLAVNVVQGIQSEGVMATAKHFVANNMEYGRMDHSSNLDERTLRELYLPAFEACIKEGKVAALMDAYNLVNGVYMTENARLNIDIAKKEWGFDGILMSDWGATHNGLAAAAGGLDLEMPSAEFMKPDLLKKALESGELPMAAVDDKVRRLLRKSIEFGFFERAQPESRHSPFSHENRLVALEMARNSAVLLKNQGAFLPLQRKTCKNLVVIGPNAYPAVPGGGGSSQTKSFVATSFVEGIMNSAGAGVNVHYIPESLDIESAAKSSRFTLEPGGAPGLKGEYFNNADLQGTPALVRVDPHILFRFEEGGYGPQSPKDRFSVRWTGYYTPDKTDSYRFLTSSDDGVRLWVDEVRVIDNWTPHGDAIDSASVMLKAGKPCKIRLEYYEDTSSAGLTFGVQASQQPLSESAKSLISQADAVVACVGFNPASEYEGGDRSFQLPSGQLDLLQQLAPLNKNVVVAMTAGGNVDPAGWLDRVRGYIHTWYPGQEGGTALGQILFGDISPSGKLPASFERRWEDNPTFSHYYPKGSDKVVHYEEGLSLGYRYYDQAPVKPLFPFGFGLSYTTFGYTDLQLTKGPGPALVTASFTLRNTGKRSGAEIAQLYVGDRHSPVPRPLKELKGFARVALEPGQSRRVTLPLDSRAFSYYDVASSSWRLTPGDFDIYVGRSSQDVVLKGKVRL